MSNTTTTKMIASWFGGMSLVNKIKKQGKKHKWTQMEANKNTDTSVGKQIGGSSLLFTYVLFNELYTCLHDWSYFVICLTLHMCNEDIS